MLLDTELSAEQSQYLSMITSSGELLLSIINDILDWVSSARTQHNTTRRAAAARLRSTAAR